MSYLEDLKKLGMRGVATDKTDKSPSSDPFGSFGGTQGGRSEKFSGLAERIREMAKRWGYASEELTMALEMAEADPEGWQRLVDHDEGRF